jgi:hypothetical protein
VGERLARPLSRADQRRRARLFAVAKRPGVVRVLALGASSTFGFENRDDETYLPQRVLDRVWAARPVMFAVPHADSGAIVACSRRGVALLRA